VFTGIIEEKGTVRETRLAAGRAGSIVIGARKVLEGTAVGDSISVSGVCQTVVDMGDTDFTVDVMPETLRRSTLGEASRGTVVNLERALLVGGRLGGDIVYGHVDTVGTVRRRWTEQNAVLLEVTIPVELARYVAPKGSIAVDGISLTVGDSGGGSFSVSVIPHTLANTTLNEIPTRESVNIEVDILAKYVRRALGLGGTPDTPVGPLTVGFLAEHGFAG